MSSPRHRAGRVTLALGAAAIASLILAAGASAASVSPTAVNFGKAKVGKVTAPQTVTLFSCQGGTGPGGPCQFNDFSTVGLRVEGDFVITSNGCPQGLAPNQSCTVQLAFKPTRRGLATGTLFTGRESISMPCCVFFDGPTVALSGRGCTKPKRKTGQKKGGKKKRKKKLLCKPKA